MIGEKAAPSALQPNGALGPTIAAIVADAGRGHVASQRYLFEDRLHTLLRPGLNAAASPLIAMEALLFGRLLVSHGDQGDIRKFAAALCAASGALRETGLTEVGSYFMAESIAVLEQLAEHGDDVAAMSSGALIQCEPPALIEQVRAIRRKATEEAA